MFTTFYRLLLKADPSSTEEKAAQKQKVPASAKQPRTRVPKAEAAASTPKKTEPTEKDTGSSAEKTQGRHGSLPQLHINIQLHISPETTAEQIDKIFESMARHLKDFRV
jgi:hypothetical protein